MSETRNKKYDMTEIHLISDRDGIIESKPIYDKDGNEVKSPITIKGPEELEKEGYIVIEAEPTINRETDHNR